MNALRDPLRELTYLARAAEPGSHDLGSYVSAHADILSPLLRTSPGDLRASANVADEIIAAKILRRLSRVRGEARVERDGRLAQVSLRAAAALGSQARWAGGVAVLEVGLLLGDLLADKKTKYVVFEGENVSVTVARQTLADVRSQRRSLGGLTAFVDGAGLHFRWRGGRGGFNWRNLAVPSAASALHIPLRPRPAEHHRGAWLGDVLREVGFTL